MDGWTFGCARRHQKAAGTSRRGHLGCRRLDVTIAATFGIGSSASTDGVSIGCHGNAGCVDRTHRLYRSEMTTWAGARLGSARRRRWAERPACRGCTLRRRELRRDGDEERTPSYQRHIIISSRQRLRGQPLQQSDNLTTIDDHDISRRHKCVAGKRDDTVSSSCFRSDY